MISGYAPLWYRVLTRVAPFLFKRCHAERTNGNGNIHWRWDRLCYCMVNSHCVGGKHSWRGGILDLATGKELFTEQMVERRIEARLARTIPIDPPRDLSGQISGDWTLTGPRQR